MCFIHFKADLGFEKRGKGKNIHTKQTRLKTIKKKRNSMMIFHFPNQIMCRADVSTSGKAEEQIFDFVIECKMVNEMR